MQAHRRMAKLKNDGRALGIKTKTPGIHTVPQQGTASFSCSKLYNMFTAKKNLQDLTKNAQREGEQLTEATR